MCTARFIQRRISRKRSGFVDTKAPVQVRALTESDVESALGLQRPEGWNQTERDWRRLIRMEPQGCFAAEVNGTVVATVTTSTYGQTLAWVGMMLVHPHYRRQGIGKKLLSTALNY